MECPDCGYVDEDEAFEVEGDSSFQCPECDNEIDEDE